MTQHLERLPGRSGDRDTLVVQWNDVAREAMRSTKLDPPMVARAHPGAYSDYTGYEAVNTPDRIRDPNRTRPSTAVRPSKSFSTAPRSTTNER